MLLPLLSKYDLLLSYSMRFPNYLSMFHLMYLYLVYCYSMYYFDLCLTHSNNNFHNLLILLILLPNQILLLFYIGYHLDMSMHLIQNIHNYLDLLRHSDNCCLQHYLLVNLYGNISHLILVMYIIL